MWTPLIPAGKLLKHSFLTFISEPLGAREGSVSEAPANPVPVTPGVHSPLRQQPTNFPLVVEYNLVTNV